MADEDPASEQPHVTPADPPSSPVTVTSTGSPTRRWGLRLARIILVAAGIAMLTIGAAAALRDSGLGTMTVPIVVGFLLVLSPFLLDRLEEIPPGESGPRLPITRTLGELGAHRTARVLDATDLARLADAYGFIHHVLDSPQYRAARVRLQDTMMSRAAEIAMTSSFDAGEVRRAFRDGPPVVRAITLGLMDGDLALADAATVISAVTDSRSANEQLHGLQLASRVWHRLEPQQRRVLLDHVKGDPRITAHSDRSRIAEELQQRAEA